MIGSEKLRFFDVQTQFASPAAAVIRMDLTPPAVTQQRRRGGTRMDGCKARIAIGSEAAPVDRDAKTDHGGSPRFAADRVKDR